MSKDRDSQWQQQKTDEVSTFEHSGFTHSSTLDSRLDKDKQRPRPSRNSRRGANRRPSWVLLLILMVILAGVAVLKVGESPAGAAAAAPRWVISWFGSAAWICRPSRPFAG